MTRVLVTGASGFIGSHLSQRLAAAGHTVTATARRATSELQAALRLPVVAWDVLDAGADPPVDADVLVHCATANDIASRDFAAGVSLTVLGTRNVLEVAVRRGMARVVFFSTLQVYGTELHGVVDEDTPVRCESPYALNHFLGEEVCRMYAATRGLDVVLMRPANVYGVPAAPTVDRRTLVPYCFVEEASTTGRVTLRSSGRQRRNFVSLDEVADACLHLLGGFPAGATCVNVGSGWTASIREVADMVAASCAVRAGATVPVVVQSEEPPVGNDFTVGSRVAHLRRSDEGARAHMRAVIDQLRDRCWPRA